MTELTIELDRLIQKAALDGALTKDAVQMFGEVLQENEDIKHDLEKQNKDLTKMQKDRDELTTKLNIANTLVKVAAEAEMAMMTREKEMTKLELLAEYSAIRVTDHKEMVKLVFRNPVTLAQVVTPGHAGHVDQYGTVQNQEYSQTHDTKKEDT